MSAAVTFLIFSSLLVIRQRKSLLTVPYPYQRYSIDEYHEAPDDYERKWIQTSSMR
jgi:hypothetical protein